MKKRFPFGAWKIHARWNRIWIFPYASDGYIYYEYLLSTADRNPALFGLE